MGPCSSNAPQHLCLHPPPTTHHNHEQVADSIPCRCTESAVCATETGLFYRPCPSPSASRLAASPSARNSPAASLRAVQQALEKALLQSNEDFWVENPPHSDAMDQQDPVRRNRLAVQLFLRLHILVACQGMTPTGPHPTTAG